jgi:hypothetical protein
VALRETDLGVVNSRPGFVECLAVFPGTVRVKILVVRPVNRCRDVGKHSQYKG